ncbi:unnamed protein product [Spirodela intermedia]|uniref:Uncharacterized protein n=1 Tax=Spirodela intermedia TaxID=51605 RepID=A0A7I8KP84_SPIIN|nr:unnamed protein product [Spirodela intermedia]
MTRAVSSAGVIMVMVMMMVVVVVLVGILAHVISVLPIGVVLGLNIVVLSGAIGPADVKGDVLCAVDAFHGVLRGGHELRGQAEFAVGAEDGERGDVTVAGLGRVLLHLRENVSDDLAAIVLRDVEKLRPRQDVIEVVLHLVVLRQAHQVAGLHRQQVVHRRLTDAHHLALPSFPSERNPSRKLASFPRHLSLSLSLSSLPENSSFEGWGRYY